MQKIVEIFDKDTPLTSYKELKESNQNYFSSLQQKHQFSAPRTSFKPQPRFIESARFLDRSPNHSTFLPKGKSRGGDSVRQSLNNSHFLRSSSKSPFKDPLFSGNSSFLNILDKQQVYFERRKQMFQSRYLERF